MKQIKKHSISHMGCPSLGQDLISLRTSICTRPNNSLKPFLMSSKWDLSHFIYEIRFISSIWFKNHTDQRTFLYNICLSLTHTMAKLAIPETCDHHIFFSYSHQHEEQHHWVTETWDHYHKSTAIKFTRRRATFALYINFKIIL